MTCLVSVSDSENSAIDLDGLVCVAGVCKMNQNNCTQSRLTNIIAVDMFTSCNKDKIIDLSGLTFVRNTLDARK